MKRLIPLFAASLLALLPHTPVEAQPSSRSIEIDISANESLAGTLNLPEGTPRAAALLITGSGLHVRDQIISGTPTFAELANALAADGIATLRVDEMGAGESVGEPAADFHARSLHVRAAFNVLRESLETSQIEVGLIGHSEGAIIAPWVARASDDVDFLVLLAAPTERGSDVWVEQQMALSLAEDPQMSGEAQTQLRSALTGVASAAAADAPLSSAVTQLFQAWGAPDHAYTDGSIEGFAGQMRTSGMRAFLAHDPGPVLEEMNMPVLAVYADGDLQTSAAQNLPALLDDHRPQGPTTSVVLPGADHFFLFLPDAPVNEHRYGQMQLLPEMPDVVARWILEDVEE